MTRSEVEAFLTVVHCGTLSAAAEKLYITQPALSRRIQSLETELGYCLLRREKGRRSAELTEEGQTFFPLAQRWVQLLGEIHRLPTGGSTLRVSSIGSLNYALFPALYRSFLSSVPGYRLQLSSHHSDECYDLLAGDGADVGFITNPRYSRQVLTIPLFQEPMVLLCRQESSFSAARSPRELPVEREIRLPWTAEFDRWHDYWFGFAAPYVVTDEMALLEVFLQSADCFAFAPLSLARHFCSRGPFGYRIPEDPPPARTIYLLRRNVSADAVLTPFLEFLRRELGTLPDLTLLYDRL